MTTIPAEVLRLAQRGRRAEARGKTLARIAENLVLGFLMALLRGWLFMLAVGVAHAEWLPALPTIGYGTSVLIVALLPYGGRSGTKDER